MERPNQRRQRDLGLGVEFASMCNTNLTQVEKGLILVVISLEILVKGVSEAYPPLWDESNHREMLDCLQLGDVVF